MRRRVLWLVGAALLLPVAGLGLAAALLDPNEFKPQIAAAVQRATGRALELRGPVRIGRSLWPTIEVADVTLANLPGGSRPDMVRAERISAQLSLPALLRRRIEIGELRLVQPNILLELVNGRPNWVLGDAAPRGSDNGQEAGSGARPDFDVRVGAAEVRDGMVTLRLPRRTHVVGIRTLSFRRPVEGGPLELATELVYQDNRSFRLHAVADPTGTVTDPWNARLTFAAFDATIAASGRMSLAGAYDLQLDAHVPALEKLNALLPALQLPALHGMEVATHVTSGATPGDLPVIGTTRLRFGSADLADRVPGLQLGAVELALPQAGGKAAAKGTGRYAGRGFSWTGSLDMPDRLDGTATAPVALQVRATPQAGRPAGADDGTLTLDGDLSLSDAAFAGLDAAAGLRLPALEAWQPLLPAVLPALTDVTLRGRVTLPADLGTVRLRGAALAARQVEAAGDVTLGLGNRLALNGKLRAARLDLDALLGEGAGTPASAPGGPLIPDTPLPWQWVRGRVVDLSASIAALTLRQQVWHDVDLALEVAGDRLQLARLRLALPQEPAELAISADATSSQGPVSLDLRALGVPLGLITRTLRLPGAADGALRVQALLRARGRSAHDLAASLDGTFSATMRGGRVSNAALRQVAAAALDALGIQVPAAGDTAIRCFGLVGGFRSGIGQLRTVALDSTYLRLAGAGQVDLGAERLSLALRPLARLAGSAVEVPVTVTGPFRGIEGRLDADAFDKLGLLVDALTGGDDPAICSEAGLGPVPAARP